MDTKSERREYIVTLDQAGSVESCLDPATGQEAFPGDLVILPDPWTSRSVDANRGNRVRITAEPRITPPSTNSTMHFVHLRRPAGWKVLAKSVGGTGAPYHD